MWPVNKRVEEAVRQMLRRGCVEGFAWFQRLEERRQVSLVRCGHAQDRDFQPGKGLALQVENAALNRRIVAR